MTKVAQDTKYSAQEILNNVFDEDDLTLATNDSSLNTTAANTTRTTATGVQPVQHIDAAGTVGGVTLNTLISGEDQTNDVLKTEQQFSIAYQAAAAANVVVKASAGFLHAIIVGAWIANGTIEVSDHASDGDGNVKIFITEAATNIEGFPKVFIVDAKFATGICVDQTTAIQCSYIYR